MEQAWLLTLTSIWGQAIICAFWREEPSALSASRTPCFQQCLHAASYRTPSKESNPSNSWTLRPGEEPQPPHRCKRRKRRFFVTQTKNLCTPATSSSAGASSCGTAGSKTWGGIEVGCEIQLPRSNNASWFSIAAWSKPAELRCSRRSRSPRLLAPCTCPANTSCTMLRCKPHTVWCAVRTYSSTHAEARHLPRNSLCSRGMPAMAAMLSSHARSLCSVQARPAANDVKSVAELERYHPSLPRMGKRRCAYNCLAMAEIAA